MRSQNQQQSLFSLFFSLACSLQAKGEIHEGNKIILWSIMFIKWIRFSRQPHLTHSLFFSCFATHCALLVVINNCNIFIISSKWKCSSLQGWNRKEGVHLNLSSAHKYLTPKRESDSPSRPSRVAYLPFVSLSRVKNVFLSRRLSPLHTEGKWGKSAKGKMIFHINTNGKNTSDTINDGERDEVEW